MKELEEWLIAQFDAGRKDLNREDPFWRQHFLAKTIENDLDMGRRVPLAVLMISNEPLTAKEIEKGQRLFAVWNAKKQAESHDI